MIFKVFADFRPILIHYHSIHCRIRALRYIQRLQVANDTKKKVQINKTLEKVRLIGCLQFDIGGSAEKIRQIKRISQSAKNCIRNYFPFVNFPTLKSQKHLQSLSIYQSGTQATILKYPKITQLIFNLLSKGDPTNFSALQLKRLSKLNNVGKISLSVKWTADSLGKIRRIIKTLSEYPQLKSSAVHLIEDDVCTYIHSLQFQKFWNSLEFIQIEFQSFDSVNCILDFSNRIPNLKTLVLKSGDEFIQNVIKKGNCDMKNFKKLESFKNLQSFKFILDLTELILQSIDLMKSIKYPSSLNSLLLDWKVPDFDALIQKSTSSLSLTTYLTVEKQPPFKEFIANHENLSKIKCFKLSVKTSQMLAAHIKLFPALIKPMTDLQNFSLEIHAQIAKPFRYLQIYNNFMKQGEVKYLNLNLPSMEIDFSGSELLHIDNRMSTLREVHLECANTNIPNEVFEPFFESLCIQTMETICLNFKQIVTDRQLEKRFNLLQKCNYLRTFKASFIVSNLSQITLEQLQSMLNKTLYLQVLCLEILGSNNSAELLKQMLEPTFNNHKHIYFAFVQCDLLGIMKTKQEKSFIYTPDQINIFLEEYEFMLPK